MKKGFSSIILVVMFIIGLALVLYPSIANYWNQQVQSRAIVDYEAMLKSLTKEDYSQLFSEADTYNSRIRELEYPLMNYDQVDGYYDILNIGGNGVIGYIMIEKIGVELPIYHGTSVEVLNVAAGHLEGTTFPIGGLSTHAAISAHRGLPSAKLFTNLDKVDVGDTFTITVLDRVLTYQIDQKLIVNPDEVDELYVKQGKDYCTLITCTPYGINTHRLLVRGVRIETFTEKQPIYVANEAFIIDPIIVTPAVAMPMLIVLLIVLLVKYRDNGEPSAASAAEDGKPAVPPPPEIEEKTADPSAEPDPPEEPNQESEEPPHDEEIQE